MVASGEMRLISALDSGVARFSGADIDSSTNYKLNPTGRQPASRDRYNC